MLTSGSAQNKLAIKTVRSGCTVKPRDEQTVQCSTALGLPRKTRNKENRQREAASSWKEGKDKATNPIFSMPGSHYCPAQLLKTIIGGSADLKLRHNLKIYKAIEATQCLLSCFSRAIQSQRQELHRNVPACHCTHWQLLPISCFCPRGKTHIGQPMAGPRKEEGSLCFNPVTDCSRKIQFFRLKSCRMTT